MNRILTALLLASCFCLASCQSAPPLGSAVMAQPILLPIKHEGAERYQLVRPWSWEWRGQVEHAPIGVVVDGASVPRLAWAFMPPDGLHRAAALGHDMAYIYRGRMPSGRVLSRKEADTMFHDLMLRAGVNEHRAAVAYAGVRVGGWVEWNRPYRGPVILPPQQVFTAKRKLPFMLGRHIYQ